MTGRGMSVMSLGGGVSLLAVGLVLGGNVCTYWSEQCIMSILRLDHWAPIKAIIIMLEPLGSDQSEHRYAGTTRL